MTVTVPAWIGLRLYRERADRGWSLKRSAAASGVSFATVMRAEQGRDVALSSFLALAGAYGVSLDVLAAVPGCARCLDRGTCGECGRDASDDETSNDNRRNP